MITSPWLKRELNPTRLPNKDGCVERIISRSKPGSGFDWLDGGDGLFPLGGPWPIDNKLYLKSSGSGALESVCSTYLCHSVYSPSKHKLLLLPSVPEAASPSVAGFGVNSMAEYSKPTSTELRVPTKKSKVEDYAVTPEKPLFACTATITKYPERGIPRNLDAKINAIISFPTLGNQGSEQSDTGNLNESRCSRISATSRVPDVVETKGNPHDAYRISSICLDGPPFTVCFPYFF